jgi:hypothetical protein
MPNACSPLHATSSLPVVLLLALVDKTTPASKMAVNNPRERNK